MIEKKVVYISGPMSGLPELNYPAFYAAEEQLKKRGYLVLNPARTPPGLKYESYMDIALAQVRACDAVCKLMGADQSKGALCELAYAASLSKKIFNYQEVGVDDISNSTPK